MKTNERSLSCLFSNSIPALIRRWVGLLGLARVQSKNFLRASVFRKFLIDWLGWERCQSVLNVEGGKGQLVTTLYFLYGLI